MLLITRLLRLVGSWDLVNRFNNANLVAVVTPTDRSKSVRNRCVIVFCVVKFFFQVFCM